VLPTCFVFSRECELPLTKLDKPHI